MKTKIPKKLTQKEFYRLLGQRAKKHKFRILDGSKEPSEKGYLREVGSGCCPVVAVARELGLKGIDPDDAAEAAVKMNLHSKICSHIMCAADGNAWYIFKPVRKKLLATLGLKEPV